MFESVGEISQFAMQSILENKKKKKESNDENTVSLIHELTYLINPFPFFQRQPMSVDLLETRT